MKPVIAVFPSHDEKAKTVQLRENYICSLTHSGALPFIVPVNLPASDLPQLLSLADGFFFSGGGDIAPETFGEEKIPQCGDPDALRDAFEFAAFSLAWRSGKPILAVCRGIQLMNVCLGGTLYQDLPTQYHAPSAIQHHQKEAVHILTHTVSVPHGTLLSDILKNEKIRTNSFHHQAVKVPAPSLTVAGICEDGVIEALCAKERRYALGVQWHPEHTYDEDTFSRQIFTSFTVASVASAS